MYAFSTTPVILTTLLSGRSWVLVLATSKFGIDKISCIGISPSWYWNCVRTKERTSMHFVGLIALEHIFRVEQCSANPFMLCKPWILAQRQCRNKVQTSSTESLLNSLGSFLLSITYSRTWRRVFSATNIIRTDLQGLCGVSGPAQSPVTSFQIVSRWSVEIAHPLKKNRCYVCLFQN